MTKLGPTHNYTVRDFAGGIVIHTSTGVAGLIVSLFMERNSEAPTLGHHNLPLNILGGVIVWGMVYNNMSLCHF
jgi:ammonia channel protein AmtB